MAFSDILSFSFPSPHLLLCCYLELPYTGHAVLIEDIDCQIKSPVTSVILSLQLLVMGVLEMSLRNTGYFHHSWLLTKT